MMEGLEAKPLKMPIALINQATHTYWNLGGHANGNILSHKIQLLASKITPLDARRSPLSGERSVTSSSLEQRTEGWMRWTVDMISTISWTGCMGARRRLSCLVRSRGGRWRNADRNEHQQQSIGLVAGRVGDLVGVNRDDVDHEPLLESIIEILSPLKFPSLNLGHLVQNVMRELWFRSGRSNACIYSLRGKSVFKLK
ncbi:hypothetical protein SASPL_154994 [Salvia splendens]|uniref:Uncharacterized protein n=1 Tax=Salvia splendens TaxID=180675 RepID=A0A8X8W118_SALSN|nr:hypothetical protein SASPL_154994 [Salvia splendens]